MQRWLQWIVLLGMVLGSVNLSAQRIVAECTVEYRVQPDSGWTEKNGDNSQVPFNGVKRIYIKGNDLRTDMESQGFLQSMIYDKSNQLSVILRVIGTNKFITRLEGSDWQQELKKYDSIQVTYLNAYKTIIGYDCKSLAMKLKDGSEYLIYYTTTIAPSVREFELAFKDVPGFVLQYIVKQNNRKVSYTATRISFSPVPASRFDIPSSGYRALKK
jgi:hypothetical protein